MSIIIHFNPTPFIPSAGTVATPACLKTAKTKLEMAPGIKHDTDVPVMTDSSIVDLATSNTLYDRMKDVKATHHVSQTLGCCFGLPYQDHNYGAPPPPTPPSYSPCASPVHTNGAPDEDTNLSVVSASTLNEETHEGSVTRCVCGFEHDDEYMICCDRCLVWQHVDCMGLDRNNIPETYMCEKCEPRKVDRQKAKVLQARKKVAMTDSSESDDDKNEKRPKTRSKSSRKKKEEEKVDEKSEHIPPKRCRSAKNIKERMEIKRSKLRRNKNKESTSTADEEAQDAWEYSLELCEKHFEAAVNNQYTPEIQLIARTLQNQSQDVKTLEQLQVQLCHVEETESSKKRLVSVCDMSRGQPIVEYKGKFLLTSQFYEIHPLFNKRLYPFVLFHTLLQDDICIDASFYGNDARFIRRSCKPNAEICHAIFNGNLHLYISSTKEIFKDEEITIPFDFSQNDSIKDIDCACERDYCVLRLNKKNGDGEVCEKKKRLRRFTSSADDDSSHSLAGLTSSPIKSKQSPVKNSSSNQVSPISTSLIDHMDIKGTSDHEPEEQSSERRRKMTREERKIDAIMRAFDQMEKAAKRRQQALDRLAQQKAQQPKTEEASEKQEITAVTTSTITVTTTATTTTVKEEEKPTVASSSETSCVEEEKITISTPPPKPKKGKRRRGSGTQARRRIRTNSGGSDILSADDSVPQVQSNVQITTPISSVESTSEILPSVVPSHLTSPQSSELSTEPTTPTHALLKTKRSLLQEWMHVKSESTGTAQSPCSVKKEVSWNTNADAPTYYVRCIKDGPNVVGISAAHLRRSSTSGQLRPATGQGSAKKRWLRQAMYDCNTLEELSIVDPSSMEALPSPLHNGGLSPVSHGDANSPSPSADDIVTPLKKRRLMRESIESIPSPKSPSSIPSSLDWTTTSTASCSCDSKADFLLTETMDSEELSSEVEKTSLPIMKDEIVPTKVNGLRTDLVKVLTENCVDEEIKMEVTSDPICVSDDVDKSLIEPEPAEEVPANVEELIPKSEINFENTQVKSPQNCTNSEIFEVNEKLIPSVELSDESANSESSIAKVGDCMLPSLCNQSPEKSLEEHSSETKDEVKLMDCKELLTVKQCEEPSNTNVDVTSEVNNSDMSQSCSDVKETSIEIDDSMKTDEVKQSEGSSSEVVDTVLSSIRSKEEILDTVVPELCSSGATSTLCKSENENSVKMETDPCPTLLVSSTACEGVNEKSVGLALDSCPTSSISSTACMSINEKSVGLTLDSCPTSSISSTACMSINEKSVELTLDSCPTSSVSSTICKSINDASVGLSLDSCSTSVSSTACTRINEKSIELASDSCPTSSASSTACTSINEKSVELVSDSSTSSVSSTACKSINENSTGLALDSCPTSSVTSTSVSEKLAVLQINTPQVLSLCSDVVPSVTSDLTPCSSSSTSAVVSSEVLTCSQSSAVTSDSTTSSAENIKLKKPAEPESPTKCSAPSNTPLTPTTQSALATQKRKVSLSEYRLRMKEGPSKIRPPNDIIKEKNNSTSSISTIVGLNTPPEQQQVTLKPLPFCDTRVVSPSPVKQSKKRTKPTFSIRNAVEKFTKSLQSPKPKKEIVVAADDDDDNSDTTEHHRENLTERLRREFGLDDDSEEGSPIPVVVSTPKPKLSTVSASMTTAPRFSLCAQPPPPPPPPPRLPRTPQQGMGTAPLPSPTQFNYPLTSPFSRPPFIVAQVPGSTYVSTQPPIPAPVVHPAMHPLTPTPPHPMHPLLPYAPSLPGTAMRPTQHDYSSVNAQNFATLVQQPPPPPPNQGYHMYQAGFFK